VFYFWRKLIRTVQRGLSAIAEHFVLIHKLSIVTLLSGVIFYKRVPYTYWYSYNANRPQRRRHQAAAASHILSSRIQSPMGYKTHEYMKIHS